MKKSILISAIIACSLLTSNDSKADASKEKNIGFFSGAISGAAIGGPVGFIVGGVSGAVIGDQVDKANHLEEVQQELANTKLENGHYLSKVQSLEGELTNSLNHSQKASDWITQGLTLNLMFTTNSTKLSENDLKMIKRLSDVMHSYQELNIKLDGYADPRGDVASNLALSMARIKAVEKTFVENGIAISRLNMTAHGENTNKGNDNDLDAYAMERRVSINFFTNNDQVIAQN